MLICCNGYILNIWLIYNLAIRMIMIEQPGIINPAPMHHIMYMDYFGTISKNLDS